MPTIVRVVDGTFRTVEQRKGKLASAIGMRRAKDGNAGGYLWHTPDGGRLYFVRDSPHYYLCAQCDAEGRDPIVPNREAFWTPDNVSPGSLVDDEEAA